MGSETRREWLEEAARYFENRPIGGEDKAHWANVYNAENCRKIATALSAQEEELGRLRGLLTEAREWINDWADTAREHDLVARIDAALEGSKRDG